MTELPADRAERFEREARPERRERPACSPSAPSSATTSRPRSPRGVEPAPPAQTLANWVTGELVRAPRTSGEDPAGSPRRSRGALAALVGLVAAKRVSVGAGRQVLDRLVAEGGDPQRDRRGARGSPRWTAATSWPRSSPPRSPPTPTPPSACAKATPRRSARSSGTSCARPRAAPTATEVARLVNEQLGL